VEKVFAQAHIGEVGYCVYQTVKGGFIVTRHKLSHMTASGRSFLPAIVQLYSGGPMLKWLILGRIKALT
tara:strand:- start:6 stop:212 length:207 start_codon:yes stop_codon:yes gene_type:complete